MEGVLELAAPKASVPRLLGEAAGLLASGLVAGVCGGAAWGLVRPSLVIGHGGIVDVVATDPGAVFTSVGWLSVILGVIGAVLATIAWFQSRGREAWYLLWLIAVSVASTFAVLAVGDFIAVRQHSNDASRVAAPLTTPAAWLVAPFSASAIYWTRTLVAYVSPRADG